jgi:hypothetical protein
MFKQQQQIDLKTLTTNSRNFHQTFIQKFFIILQISISSIVIQATNRSTHSSHEPNELTKFLLQLWNANKSNFFYLTGRKYSSTGLVEISLRNTQLQVKLIFLCWLMCVKNWMLQSLQSCLSCSLQKVIVFFSMRVGIIRKMIHRLIDALWIRKLTNV